MQIVTDGVLSAALKQQLRQWRPVQVRKGDGLKVKRVRRAAEDMTVEGLSAARQHAADRWRMVQPFGEPDDKTPEPLEPPPSPVPSSDRTVPASGLIASAGAMVSGRRRAARVAAGEIDDDQPTTSAESPAPEPQASPPSPEQERKRKVEEQLMELQREARRQIEAERQARADQRAQAEREAAEEAVRQAAAREEAARQEAARQEAERQEAARREAERREAARQETQRQEAARQEAERQEAARQAAEREEAARREAAAREEASGAQPESVLDMLKAQGLRAGGRRRAPDAEASSGTPSDTPSWRVEPPSRLRQDEPAPNYLADQGTPDSPSRSGLAAAFSRPPAAPDFGPHLDDPAPAYPLQTPAGGFPATPADRDERTLPERDYTSLDFTAQRWATSSVPSPGPAEHPDPAQPAPDPDHKPLPPIPDPVPSVPTPDEIPRPQDPDLLSTSFLSSADVEPEDDTSDLPTTPVRLDHPAATEQPGAGAQPDFGTPTGLGPQPTFGTQSFGTQPTFGTQSFGAQSFGTQPTFGSQTGFGTEQPDQGNQPDPAGWANFEIAPDFDVDPIVRMSTAPEADPATDAARAPATDAEADSLPEYDFFATESEPAHQDPAVQPAVAEPGTSAPTEYEAAGIVGPSESKDESVTRTGRPSSRRKPSDLSLADLLAEALVAYETGRRSDEEQLEAADLATREWSPADGAPPTAAEQPSTTDSYFTASRPSEQVPAGTDPLFRPGESFGAQAPEPAAGAGPAADSLFQPGLPFGYQAPESTAETGAASDFLFDSGRPSFGVQPPPAESAVSQASPERPFAAERPAEPEQEKTGPIVPVGAAPDSETTGPIRPVSSDGPAGWTLPGN